MSSAPTAQDMLETYSLTPEDLDRVRKHGEHVVPRLGQMIESFYDWMRTRPEFDQFFSSPRKLASVKEL